MKPPNPKLSHSKQKILFLSLSSVASVAVIQQLFFPIRPALPRVPVALPSSITSLDLNLAPQGLKPESISFERQYLAGRSQHYLSRNGDYLILTPLSSWMLISINPLDISGELTPKQQLLNAKILTVIPNKLQIATGKIGSSPAYQGCLTPNGQVAIDAQQLAAPKPSFGEKTLNTVWPSSLYSFSCVLITTNQRLLLDGSKTSRVFLKELDKSIVWPR
ncbi:hypothetical protein [Synechococcus sp. EJ6-Ellesmere]|uniref:hypothetical protein n=1 Tax=Synechococcus sp. EJ6-Ellesmere TaxID=2823734 RepID=UPI0020CDC3C8|nr:hypothetical protein [Synechococcus sp. EJ6-Ellesmere]MCP9825581.1 hypothetical protein [Synechococcus sp. EJ6-Ellesmere]